MLLKRLRLSRFTDQGMKPSTVSTHSVDAHYCNSIFRGYMRDPSYSMSSSVSTNGNRVCLILEI